MDQGLDGHHEKREAPPSSITRPSSTPTGARQTGPSALSIRVGYLQPPGHRLQPQDQVIPTVTDNNPGCCSNGQCNLCLVRKGVSGKDAVFTGPFGERKVTYCDYTASGKPLDFLERFMADFVQPFYANTHTTSNITGTQTSEFRQQARDIIKDCVNASKDDVVIFTGSGTTGAIHKLVGVMKLEGARAKNTVVMTGPFEHHSNILPWKEKPVKFERIGQSNNGLLDLRDLENKLWRYSTKGYNIIVALSAASNVTGITTDTRVVTELVHKYGGLSFWDYAACGPYVKIDMNPSVNGAKDAVYLSPHKFVGGPGTPGVLIAKRKLFSNDVPHGCGGGTVVYVTRETHLYYDSIEDREEGGTPPILGSIRAGLVFKLKKDIGEDLIHTREAESCRRVFSQLGSHPNISILGSHTAHRLPIFSLLFYNPQSGRYLHHNFISTLLNDLYGIQVRSGCACAGPYAMDLLHMDEYTATRFAGLLSDGWCCTKRRCSRDEHYALGVMKPGFSRFNVPYFMDGVTVEYVLDALTMVATHGWKLLPMYTYDSRTGDWTHRSCPKYEVNSLHNFRFGAAGVSMRERAPLRKSGRISLDDMKTSVLKVFQTAEATCQDIDCSADPEIDLGKEYEELRWFVLPSEVQQLLNIPEHCRPYTTYADSKLPFKTTQAATCHHTPASSDSAYSSLAASHSSVRSTDSNSGAEEIPKKSMTIWLEDGDDDDERTSPLMLHGAGQDAGSVYIPTAVRYGGGQSMASGAGHTDLFGMHSDDIHTVKGLEDFNHTHHKGLKKHRRMHGIKRKDKCAIS